MTRDERTKLEHAAGREALNRAMFSEVSLKVLEEGEKGLRRRHSAILATNIHSVEDAWFVKVSVRCADGTAMDFFDPFLGFPNDTLLAQLALVMD